MSVDALSATFAALADPTRRAILARQAQGEATVNELAAHGKRTEMIFRMALPAHLSAEQVRAWFATGYREGWTWGIGWLVARYRNFISSH